MSWLQNQQGALMTPSLTQTIIRKGANADPGATSFVSANNVESGSTDFSRLRTVAVKSGRRFFSLERGLYNVTSANTTVTVYGLFDGWGSDGTITVNWELQDGSITAGSSGYTAQSGAWVVTPGQVGFVGQEITINNVDLSQGAQHFIFKITSASILGGPNLLKNAFDFAYIQVDDGSPEAAALVVDKDHVSASDSNPGTVASPFLTIQKGITEAIAQSKRLYIRESATPYTEITRLSASDAGGPTINRTGGGSFTDMLKIQGYPGERPVIDNNYQLDSNSSSACPLYFMDGDYVWVKNITGRNCAAGFTFAPNTATSHFVLENLESFGHVGGGTLGSIASAGNTGGFRLDETTRTLIHNCKIHDTYDKRRTAWRGNPYGDANISAHAPWTGETSYSVNDVRGSNGNYYICTTAGTSAGISTDQDGLSGTGTGIVDNTCVWDYQSAAPTVGGVIVYDYHAGVHGFRDDQCLIEYSELYNVNRPIFCKEQKNAGVQARCVRNNDIHDYGNSAVDVANQGARDHAQLPLMYFNKLVEGESKFSCRYGGANGAQAANALCFSNSAYNVSNGFSNDQMQDMGLYNNILSGVNAAFGNEKTLTSEQDAAGYVTTIAYMDYNTYHNRVAADANRFFVDNNGANEIIFGSLTTWQTSYTDQVTVANTLSQDPDQQTVETDPNYTNPATRDLTRTGGPVDGVHGQEKGVHYDSSVNVGAYVISFPE